MTTDQYHAESQQLDSKDTNSLKVSGDGTVGAHGRSKGSGVFRAIAVLALILGLIALILSGFIWYSIVVTNRLEMNETITRSEMISEEFELLRSSQQAFESEQTKLHRNIEDNRRLLEEKFEALIKEGRTESLLLSQQQNALQSQLKIDVDVLARAMESTQREMGRGTNDWLLEEIAQLIYLANERLLLVGDLSLAIKALQIAEDRIADLSDPVLLVVRRQLVSDIGLLANVSLPDINGALLHLSILMQQVSSLPLDGEVVVNGFAQEKVDIGDAEDSASTSNDVDDTISGLGRRLLKDLSNLVRVRNVETTQLPSLAPEWHFFVYESVRSPLNVAQLALLRGLPEVYLTSLDRAKAALNSSFDIEAAEVIKFQSAIGSLVGTEIRSTYPDISMSLELLRKIIVRRSTAD
jgi:uncharacterized protein HemX